MSLSKRQFPTVQNYISRYAFCQSAHIMKAKEIRGCDARTQYAKEYIMNIDKNLLESLAAMDDDSLAASIRAIAAASGVDLSGVSFDKSKLNALRTAMRGATDEDLERAKEILKGYRTQS